MCRQDVWLAGWLGCKIRRAGAQHPIHPSIVRLDHMPRKHEPRPIHAAARVLVWVGGWVVDGWMDVWCDALHPPIQPGMGWMRKPTFDASPIRLSMQPPPDHISFIISCERSCSDLALLRYFPSLCRQAPARSPNRPVFVRIWGVMHLRSSSCLQDGKTQLGLVVGASEGGVAGTVVRGRERSRTYTYHVPSIRRRPVT